MKADSQQLPSERRFGLLFTAVFGLIAVYGWLFKGFAPLVVIILLTVGLVFALTAIIVPKVLAPFNKAWFFLGQFLGKIVSPLVLGIIFFGVLTPVGLITRLFGRDELRLKRSQKETYWLERAPPGPSGESFKNQF